MSIFSDDLTKLAIDVLAECRARGWKLTTDESCTGGLISALLTEIAGSSDVFTHGFVTYANAAKTELGVKEALIANHGAVSEEVAKAMAEAALKAAHADIAIAVTGIAGPSGGTAEKPVGLVHVACAVKNKTTHEKFLFSGDRSAIRLAAVEAALKMALKA
ncbi:MAG: CinA family protein [Alphaproteobacteria bacterium]|nr:CinA family protein [Alphaproteobacteria bacterium]